jgi:ABC-type transporter Mla subunit MlaD
MAIPEAHNCSTFGALSVTVHPLVLDDDQLTVSSWPAGTVDALTETDAVGMGVGSTVTVSGVEVTMVVPGDGEVHVTVRTYVPGPFGAMVAVSCG